MSPYLAKIQNWVNQSGIEVVLPTAVAEEEKVFNSGYWFTHNGRERFYKTGLTDSEKQFFSVPENPGSKIFQTKGYKLAVLICYEMEHEAWTYFQPGQADVLLWPGYWGWTIEDTWGSTKNQDKPNTIFSNMSEWKMPILQSNFAYNDLNGHKGAGPEGLSFVINEKNKLIYKGSHLKAEGFIVQMNKVNGKTIVLKCSDL